jgi:dipeptidyl-peptidase-4
MLAKTRQFALVLAFVCISSSGCETSPAPPQPTAATSASAWPEPDDTVLEQIASTLSFSLGAPAGIWVAPDGSEVLFRRSTARSFVADLYAFDVASGRERRLISAEELLGGAAENLSVEERARRERMRLATRGITAFSSDEAGSRLLIPLSGRLFVLDRRGGAAARELRVPGPVLDARLSPDGRRVACVSEGDLYVLDASGQEPWRRLTTRASEAIEHGLAEFVAQEEMSRFQGYWWSPDSRSIAYQKSDLSQVETLHISDATHPEQAPQAFRYPRVGGANAEVTLGVFELESGRSTWVQWDRSEYPYLAAVSWQKHAPLTLVVQNRAQTEELVLAAAANGATRRLLSERDPAWLNLDASGPPYWAPDGQSFLWSSERNGGWELELRGADGELLRTLTPAAFGYQAFGGFDLERRAAWVLASPDSRQSQVYRVPLDGSPIERVTQSDGNYALRASTQSGVAVVVGTEANGARHARVRRADGSWAGELSSLAEVPAALPVPEFCSVQVDGRMHHAAVLRPRSFVPGRRYPVLLSVYGGPHRNYVTLDPYGYLTDQWYADGGFIVVRGDGRGTPGRGRDWERSIHQRLASVPLEDQVAILQAVAAQRPELDLGRVGILGWSFGGYLSAMAVELRPDVFHAAAAGAPVTDWRDYDTHYTERYMGLLAGAEAAYDESSALTHAAQLERPLLLIHGTTDDNVYFTHTLKLSQALFRAGKPFEMLPLAGFTHMVPDPVVKRALSHRILDFFRHNL